MRLFRTPFPVSPEAVTPTRIATPRAQRIDELKFRQALVFAEKEKATSVQARDFAGAKNAIIKRKMLENMWEQVQHTDQTHEDTFVSLPAGSVSGFSYDRSLHRFEGLYSATFSCEQPTTRSPSPPTARPPLPLAPFVKEDEIFDADPPEELVDSIISQDLIHQAVFTPNGDSYDRKVIGEWIAEKSTCPVTRLPLKLKDLTPNRRLQQQIDAWKTAHRVN